MYKTLPKEFLEPEYYNPSKIRGMLKHPFRCAVIGASGSMKTNSVLNIIRDAHCWEKIYLIAKDLEEPLYKYLINTLRAMEKKLGVDVLTCSTNINDVPDLDTLDRSEQTLVICDDLLGENLKKAKNIGQIFIRGRKVNCSIFFISQTFYDIPKDWRLQCNYFILKSISDESDIKGILRGKKLGKKIDDIFKMYEASTKEENFFKISIGEKDPSLRFTMNYNQIPSITDTGKKDTRNKELQLPMKKVRN